MAFENGLDQSEKAYNEFTEISSLFANFYNPKNWSTLYDFIIFLTLYFMAFWLTKMESYNKLESE